MSNAAIKDAISGAVQAQLPVLVWGPPGTGKTSFMKQLAADRKVPIETIIASIREPSDFSGLPVVTENGVKMEAPAWAKRLAETGTADGSLSGILFFDEITTCAPATQAALLRVINEGVVGEVELPGSVARVAAANPPEMAAGGWNLTAPLANRFIHIDWPNNPMEWADAAVAGWKSATSDVKVPAHWKSTVPAKVALVSSYIRTRPDKLLVMPKQESEMGKAWSSPRSWEMAAFALAVIEATGTFTDDSQIYLLGGAVGNANAQEFLTWMRELDLPDPESLLRNPDKFKLPERPDKTYAVLSSVVSVVLNDLTEDRWIAGWKVLAAAAKQGQPDIAAFAAKAFIKNADDSFDYKRVLPIVTAFTPILKEAGLMLGS